MVVVTVVWTRVSATHRPDIDVVRKALLTVGRGQHSPTTP